MDVVGSCDVALACRYRWQILRRNAMQTVVVIRRYVIVRVLARLDLVIGSIGECLDQTAGVDGVLAALAIVLG